MSRVPLQTPAKEDQRVSFLLLLQNRFPSSLRAQPELLRTEIYLLLLTCVRLGEQKAELFLESSTKEEFISNNPKANFFFFMMSPPFLPCL